jgi:predicted RNA methylase
MIEYLEERGEVRGNTVCELGAGTGALGVYIAKNLSPGSLLLTDIDE